MDLARKSVQLKLLRPASGLTADIFSWAGRRPAPRSGPGAPPAPLGFGLGPIATQPRRAGPRAHDLAPARTPPRRGLIFQSITRFGMTGWVGDPTTGSPGLASPPVDGPQPLVQQRRPLRRSPLCSGNRFCPVEMSCPRWPPGPGFLSVARGRAA